MEVAEDSTVNEQKPLNRTVKLDATNPQTAAFNVLVFFFFLKTLMYSDHTGYVRTVFSYWYCWNSYHNRGTKKDVSLTIECEQQFNIVELIFDMIFIS